MYRHSMREASVRNMALTGKTAIITGSSSGIGAGIAENFAKEGAQLSLTGRSRDNLEAVAKRCQQYNCEVITTVGDITEDNIRQSLVQNTVEHFGKVDILVNNAGIVLPTSLTDVKPEDYDEQMNVNLRSPVLLTALATSHLKESKGCVLNISSAASILAKKAENADRHGQLLKTPTNATFGFVPKPPACGVYAMTKAALDMYTKTLARELGPSGVRVNSLNPGFVQTPMLQPQHQTKEQIKESLERLTESTPLRRLGTTEEMGKIAVFLVSDSAGYITGENIIADGGVLLMPGFK